MTMTTSHAYHRDVFLCDRLAEIVAEGPAAIDRRLCQLEREWTSGRLVKATAAGLLILSLALTAAFSPWWLILTGVATLVLTQYWFFKGSWLAQLYAHWGFRSGAQIEDERLVLRVLRGDFRHLPTLHQIEDRDAMTRLADDGGYIPDDDDEKYDPREAARKILQGTC